jgi:hypothetical protein
VQINSSKLQRTPFKKFQESKKNSFRFRFLDEKIVSISVPGNRNDTVYNFTVPEQIAQILRTLKSEYIVPLNVCILHTHCCNFNDIRTNFDAILADSFKNAFSMSKWQKMAGQHFFTEI